MTSILQFDSDDATTEARLSEAFDFIFSTFLTCSLKISWYASCSFLSSSMNDILLAAFLSSLLSSILTMLLRRPFDFFFSFESSSESSGSFFPNFSFLSFLLISFNSFSLRISIFCCFIRKAVLILSSKIGSFSIVPPVTIIKDVKLTLEHFYISFFHYMECFNYYTYWIQDLTNLQTPTYLMLNLIQLLFVVPCFVVNEISLSIFVAYNF